MLRVLISACEKTECSIRIFKDRRRWRCSQGKEFNLTITRDPEAFLPTDRARTIRGKIFHLSPAVVAFALLLCVRIVDLAGRGEVMLRSANEFKDFSIGATDGDIGQVEGFYFDDRHWTVRYIIVNTGGWFSERKVLISLYAVDGTNWNNRTIDTTLTREEVKESPRIDVKSPTARDHEAAYNGHHKFPNYWAGPELWGPVRRPAAVKKYNRENLSVLGGWPGALRRQPTAQ